MTKKYELTENKKVHNGRTLYQIRALKDFDFIKKGDLGGWVESEDNLSQEGECWIYDNSKVYDNAIVKDHASIALDSEICGKAIICDNSVIQNCCIKGRSIIKSSSFIQNSIITGYSTINVAGIAIYNSKLKHCIAIRSSFEGINIIRNECLVGKQYSVLDIINTKKITRNYFNKSYTFYKVKDKVYVSTYSKSFISIPLKKLFDKLFKTSKYDIDEIKKNAAVLSEILEEFNLPLNMGCNNKYELLLDDITEYNSKILFRIRYLNDNPKLSNRLGGYVSNYSTLPADNDSIIDFNSIVADSKLYSGDIINSIVIKSHIYKNVENSYVSNSNIYNKVRDCKINKATILPKHNIIFKDLNISNCISNNFISQEVCCIKYTFYMKTFGAIVGCYYDNGEFKEIRITKLKNSIKSTNKNLTNVLDSIAQKLK